MKKYFIRAISGIGLWLLVWSLADLGRPASNAQSAETPRTLAAGDFDEDGTPDLLSGYAGGGGGVLKFQRGNVAAVYPRSREAQQQTIKTTEPFFEPVCERALRCKPSRPKSVARTPKFFLLVRRAVLWAWTKSICEFRAVWADAAW